MVLIIANIQGVKSVCQGQANNLIYIILSTFNSTDICWAPSMFQTLTRRCMWTGTKSYEHVCKAVEDACHLRTELLEK